MDIYKLRRSVHVLNFCLHCDGALISYVRPDGSMNAISLTRDEVVEEMQRTGSLDEDLGQEDLTDLRISQWDAINICIHYEMEREIDNEAGMMNIQKAVDNLKKSVNDAY